MTVTAVAGWVLGIGLLAGGATWVAAAPPPSDTPAPTSALTAAAARPAVSASDVVETPAGPSRRPPAPGDPVRPFVAPAHEYGPGHRGVDLPAAAGSVVTAPADGVVTFAGPVAGRGVVVLTHVDGTRTSLEPVVALVPRGAVVRVGDALAEVQPTPVHAGCRSTCVHWGVRVADRYVDPWWWLGRAGPVRLLPLSGP